MATNNAINLKQSGIASYDGAGTFTGLSTPLNVSSGGTGVVSTTAYAVQCGGTAGTNPIQSIAGLGTSGQILTSNGPSALPTFQTFSGTSGFISFIVARVGGNPTDGITYFESYSTGSFVSGTVETAAITKYVMPVTGTINIFVGAILVNGTLGSNENCTLALRKNATTDTNLTTTLKLTSATNPLTFSSIGLSVTAGDTITVKFISATWGTNPTNVSIAATFLLTV